MKKTAKNMTIGIFLEYTEGHTQKNFHEDDCIFREVIEFSKSFYSNSDMM